MPNETEITQFELVCGIVKTDSSKQVELAQPIVVHYASVSETRPDNAENVITANHQPLLALSNSSFSVLCQLGSYISIGPQLVE